MSPTKAESAVAVRRPIPGTERSRAIAGSCFASASSCFSISSTRVESQTISSHSADRTASALGTDLETRRFLLAAAADSRSAGDPVARQTHEATGSVAQLGAQAREENRPQQGGGGACQQARQNRLGGLEERPRLHARARTNGRLEEGSEVTSSAHPGTLLREARVMANEVGPAWGKPTTKMAHEAVSTIGSPVRGFHHGPELDERSREEAADTFAVRPSRPRTLTRGSDQQPRSAMN